jgi:hypothetical protein
VHSPRRRGGRGEPRILYWFRTPPGVRVGRSALDEEAIRLLEEHNPDVHFDWTRMLKQAQGPTAEPRHAQPPQRRRGQPRDARSRPPGPPAMRTEPGPKPEPARPEIQQVESDVEALAPEIESVEHDAEEFDREADAIEDAYESEEPVAIDPEPIDALTAFTDEPADATGAVESSTEPELDAIRDDEPDLDVREERPPAAAEARLGAEGLARLRVRYAEVLARIAERGGDEAARAELKERAERLNPDAWVTDEEVRNALEQYEAVFDSLRAVVGRRRRRRRRRERKEKQ